MVERRILDRLSHLLEAATAIERVMAGKTLEEYSADPDLAAAAIERVTAGKTLEEYSADPDLAAAVERYLERLSEASRHVPETLKQKHPNIDWRAIADIGNVLRHAYDKIVDRRI